MPAPPEHVSTPRRGGAEEGGSGDGDGGSARDRRTSARPVGGARARRAGGPGCRLTTAGWLAVTAALATAFAVTRVASAQQPLASARAPHTMPVIEARVDVAAAREMTVQGGMAVLWPMTPYLRIGALAAGGGTRGLRRRRADGADGADGTDGRKGAWRESVRGEVLARFTPDPLTRARWRPYGQASVGVLAVRGGGRGRALIGAAVGVERAPLGAAGLRPAVELGVGGGVRVAFAMRALVP